MDVQRMYGALERHGSLSVWSTDHSQVEPVALAGLRDLWRAPCAVELAIEGSAAAGTCRSDKWIGAVCWAMSPRPGAPVSAYRLPFLASNGRNDWTALVSIAH